MSKFTETNKLEDVLEKAGKNGWIAEEDKQAISGIYNFQKIKIPEIKITYFEN